MDNATSTISGCLQRSFSIVVSRLPPAALVAFRDWLVEEAHRI
jgi:hypothetical protein